MNAPRPPHECTGRWELSGRERGGRPLAQRLQDWNQRIDVTQTSNLRSTHAQIRSFSLTASLPVLEHEYFMHGVLFMLSNSPLVRLSSLLPQRASSDSGFWPGPRHLQFWMQEHQCGAVREDALNQRCPEQNHATLLGL